MKATALIAALQSLVAKHGDLEVVRDTWEEDYFFHSPCGRPEVASCMPDDPSKVPAYGTAVIAL